MGSKELQAILTLKDKLSPQLKGLQGKIKVFAGEVARLAKKGFLVLAAATTAAALALKKIGNSIVNVSAEMEAYRVQGDYWHRDRPEWYGLRV